MAGANDVAAGKQEVVYQHLESVVKQHTQNKLVLLTLPYRHDLPARHPVNDEIAFVNAYITELGARYHSVEILDFNAVPRHHFTRHGMHLSWRGKRFLASLLVDCLMGRDHNPIDKRPSRAARPPARTARRLSTSRPTIPRTRDGSPVTLPHDTYADAVKLSLSPAAQHRSPAEDCASESLPSPTTCLPMECQTNTNLFYNSNTVYLDKHRCPNQALAPLP